MEKKVIAQCVEGIRPQPFISDQAAHLRQYQSIILTRGGVYSHGWDNTPIFFSGDPDAMPLQKVKNQVSSFCFNVPWDFFQAIQKHQVRLLHAHHGMFAVDFLDLQKWFSLPFVVSFYGYDASGFPNSSLRSRQQLKRLFETTELVIAMSEDMKKDLLAIGCPSHKLTVHHTGVDLERFSYRPPNENIPNLIILCVCDYSPKKGIQDLLTAFKIVLGRFPHAILRIVGSPITIAKEEYQKVIKYINHEGLERNVQLVPRIDYFSIVEEYHRADFFVLASATAPDGSKEGIPAVLMEAESSGLPVISTFHAGIPEAVVNGKSGYLVGEHDVSSLASAMIRMIENKERWEEMGKYGRDHMEKHFDVIQQRLYLERLYDQVLNHLSSG